MTGLPASDQRKERVNDERNDGMRRNETRAKGKEGRRDRQTVITLRYREASKLANPPGKLSRTQVSTLNLASRQVGRLAR